MMTDSSVLSLHGTRGIHISRSSCATHLHDLTGALLVTPERAPADAVRLHQVQLELCTHDFESGFGGVNMSEKPYLRRVSLVVCCWKIQIHHGRRRELDFRPLLVNLLQKEAGYHGCRGLIEVMSVYGAP